MPGAYRSPGKGLQQQSVLMLGTQINLRPSLAASLSSIRACLFALNCGRLDSAAHRLPAAAVVFGLNVTLCSVLLRIGVEYAR